MTNREIIIALITAVIAFSGAISASYLGAQYDQENWKERYNSTLKTQLFNKRLELIEKFLELNIELEEYEIYTELLGLEKEKLKAAILCDSQNKNNKDKCNFQNSKIFTQEAFIRLMSLKRKYSVTTSLSVLLFGPKTREALLKVNKSSNNWWNEHKKLSNEIYDAMYSELHYFNEQP